MRTGFQRIAQVLSDTLLRQMPYAAQESNRKLVVFSDSRQDAAKLSAGMRFSHYRDAVRQALAKSLETAGLGALAFQHQLSDLTLVPDELDLAQRYAATHQAETAILTAARFNAFVGHLAPGFTGLTYAEAARQILQRGEYGPFPISSLTEDISANLLMQGINPGGFSQNVLWCDRLNTQVLGDIIMNGTRIANPRCVSTPPFRPPSKTIYSAFAIQRLRKSQTPSSLPVAAVSSHWV